MFGGGFSGEEIPYSVVGDSYMGLLLIGCFIATVLVVAALRYFFMEQASVFFRSRPSRKAAFIGSMALRGEWFLFLEMCLMYGILYFFYLKDYVGSSLVVGHVQFIGIVSGVLVVFFLLKRLIVRAVDGVFFDREGRRRYMGVSLFLMACEGLFVMPIVYVLSYFDVSFFDGMIYVLIVFVLFRLLTIYKQKQIFFASREGFLGFFIYLCTLEIAPFFAIWSVLSIISDSLTINL